MIYKNNVKIIKNHSNLLALDVEGLYDARIPFTNPYDETITGLIVEDVLPLYDIHMIKAPTLLLPAEISDSDTGHIVKWNVGEMEASTIDYHYRLLEIYKSEEIKILINSLNKEAIKAIKRDDVSTALQKYEEIKNLITSIM